jgi:hypothetical protein
MEGGRKFPCCSKKCEQERRYSDSRDSKWKLEQEKAVKLQSMA